MLRNSVVCLSAIVLSSFAGSVTADQISSTVVFEDNFLRAASGEDSAAVGNQWKLNTKEDHRFIPKDGVLSVTRNADAKHSANLLHKAEFQNGTLAMRFKLVNEDDSFLIQFRDAAFKETKQGMLFNVRMGGGNIELNDAVIAYGIKQAMKSAKSSEPSPEQQKVLDTSKVTAPIKLDVGQWYDLIVNVQDNKLTVSIDGDEAASLSSDAIGHSPKDNFRVEVQQSLVIDKLKVSKSK